MDAHFNRPASVPSIHRWTPRPGLWYGQGRVTPSLSVVLPNYNDALFLDGALKAIFSQSRPPDEVVVVDDGSTDGSLDVISRYKVRLLRNEQNRGALFSERRGIESTTGDWLYFASANDLVLPGFFETVLSLAARYPEAGLCCSDFSVFFDSATAVVRRLRWEPSAAYLLPATLADRIRTRGGYICSTATIYRRSCLQGAGGFRDDLRHHADWFVNHVLGFRHGVGYAPEPLAAWRGGQAGAMSSKAGDWSIQREVLSRLLELLRSPEFEDVRPRFQSSGVLSFLPKIVRATLAARENRPFLSLLVARRAAALALKRGILAAAPFAVRRGFGGLQGNTAVLAALREADQRTR
jgi:glycosyltransferase involved in cell wall biosynthesis